MQELFQKSFKIIADPLAEAEDPQVLLSPHLLFLAGLSFLYSSKKLKMKKKLNGAYSAETFRTQGHELIDIMANYLEEVATGTEEGVAIPWQHPEEQLH